jgi:hypothetical protein
MCSRVCNWQSPAASPHEAALRHSASASTDASEYFRRHTPIPGQVRVDQRRALPSLTGRPPRTRESSVRIRHPLPVGLIQARVADVADPAARNGTTGRTAPRDRSRRGAELHHCFQRSVWSSRLTGYETPQPVRSGRLRSRASLHEHRMTKESSAWWCWYYHERTHGDILVQRRDIGSMSRVGHKRVAYPRQGDNHHDDHDYPNPRHDRHGC